MGGDGTDRPPDDEAADGDLPRGPGPVALGHRLGQVCADLLSRVAVDGAGITVMGSLAGGLRGARDQIAAVGALSRRLEDLQLTTGEGPCLDAFARGVPVLTADLAAELGRWPGFAPSALAAGAAAVFSFPLQLGVVRLGTLDLYRTRSGGLSRSQLASALAAGDAVTEALLTDPDTDPGAGEDIGWLPGVHADVHIASGMLSARSGMDVGTALLRLRAHAFAHGEPLHEVARRVIARTLDLTDPIHDDPRPTPDPEDDHP